MITIQLTKRQLIVVIFLLIVAVTLLSSASGVSFLQKSLVPKVEASTSLLAPKVALGTAFTYQGQLKLNGSPVNATCNISFKLFDAAGSGSPPTGGTQIGSTLTPSVGVANGLFTTQLDFGAGVFQGNARWLEITPDCGGGAVTLTPRQPLTPAPYALFSAAPWLTSGSNLSYNAGNVGIGTTSPGQQLEITKNMLLPVAVSNTNGNLFFGGDTSAGVNGLRLFSLDAFGGGFIDAKVSASTNGILFRTDTVNGGTERMRITAGGNVGIGTPSPFAKLTVQGPGAGGGPNFVVEGSRGGFGLQILDNNTVEIGATFGTSTIKACYFTLVALVFAACSSAAEYVPTTDDGSGYAQTADLVSIAPTVKNPYDDEHSPFVVTKSTKPCDDNLLGFIVNPESGADGKKLNDHYLPLAIYGYFPAKVTLENGPIKRGDAITSSSKPGYGMRATQACKIIGYALEDADQEGTLQVFANHGETAASEVASLRGQVQAMKQTVSDLKQQNAALDARLVALEQAVSSGNVAQRSESNSPSTTWFLFGGLVVLGLVVVQQRRVGG